MKKAEQQLSFLDDDERIFTDPDGNQFGKTKEEKIQKINDDAESLIEQIEDIEGISLKETTKEILKFAVIDKAVASDNVYKVLTLESKVKAILECGEEYREKNYNILDEKLRDREIHITNLQDQVMNKLSELNKNLIKIKEKHNDR